MHKYHKLPIARYVVTHRYPKARHHSLVVARVATLSSIADLRTEHLPLLKHMKVRNTNEHLCSHLIMLITTPSLPPHGLTLHDSVGCHSMGLDQNK